MKNSQEFLKLDTIGALYIYDVLLHYIYPRIFVCEDEYNSKYLFYEITEDTLLDKWIVSKIKNKEYYDIIDKVEPVQKFINSKKSFVIQKDYKNNDEVSVQSITDKDLNLLPKENYFIDKIIDKDFETDILDVARSNSISVFDMRFYKNTNKFSLPCNIMKNLCENFQSVFNSLFTKRCHIMPYVSTARGSCIVRFSFQEPINLLNESLISNKLDIINDVFEKKDLNASLGKIDKKIQFINSYTKLLETIKKTNSDVEFNTAYPNSHNTKIVCTPSSSIKQMYDSLTDNYEVESGEFKIDANILSWDTKSRKFKLLTCENKYIEGDITNDIDFSKSLSVPGNYNVCIKIKKEHYKTSKTKTFYNLCKIGPSINVK